MNDDKVNEALRACCKVIMAQAVGGLEGLGALRNPKAQSWAGKLSHMLWMINEAISWPAERIEKKFRWLGFIQGALWVMDLQSVEDSKRQNMPAEEFKL